MVQLTQEYMLCHFVVHFGSCLIDEHITTFIVGLRFWSFTWVLSELGFIKLGSGPGLIMCQQKYK
jgi:hypothetical protein